MPNFSYTARSRSGEKVQGNLEAADRRTALMQIEKMGLVPISVQEAAAAARQKKKEKDKKPKRFKLERKSYRAPKMKLRETLLFTNELSDLLASGMTLGTALHTLSKRQTGKAQDRIVVELRDEIIQGTSMSDALAKHPETFSELYVNLVKAGEASGQMSEVLNRLCSYYEMVLSAKEKVTMALVYPAIVLTMGIGTMIFTLLFVVPRFSQIFEELGGSLPLPTQILIGMSSGLLKYGWLALIAIVVGNILFQRFVRTPVGRRWWDRTKLRMPVVKKVILANAFAQFARTLGSLLSNGVQVLPALEIVEDTMGNTVIANEIHSARERVTDGATISRPLSQGKVFPQLLTDMLAVGEEAGDLASSLEHIARRYESELDRSVKLFTTVLEPILILMMALMVGFVAVSMLMAVFDLTSGLNV